MVKVRVLALTYGMITLESHINFYRVNILDGFSVDLTIFSGFLAVFNHFYPAAQDPEVVPPLF